MPGEDEIESKKEEESEYKSNINIEDNIVDCIAKKYNIIINERELPKNEFYLPPIKHNFEIVPKILNNEKTSNHRSISRLHGYNRKTYKPKLTTSMSITKKARSYKAVTHKDIATDKLIFEGRKILKLNESNIDTMSLINYT